MITNTMPYEGKRVFQYKKKIYLLIGFNLTFRKVGSSILLGPVASDAYEARFCLILQTEEN